MQANTLGFIMQNPIVMMNQAMKELLVLHINQSALHTVKITEKTGKIQSRLLQVLKQKPKVPDGQDLVTVALFMMKKTKDTFVTIREKFLVLKIQFALQCRQIRKGKVAAGKNGTE